MIAYNVAYNGGRRRLKASDAVNERIGRGGGCPLRGGAPLSDNTAKSEQAAATGVIV